MPAPHPPDAPIYPSAEQTGRAPWKRVLDRSLTLPGVLDRLEQLDRLVSTPTLRVLLYHRVDAPAARGSQAEPDLVSADPDLFATEMAVLRERFQPVGVDDVLAALEGRPLPPRAVLATFDDGTRDFQEHAWPVLRRLGIPAVLFVPTAYVDRPGRLFWWDRLHQAILLAPLATADLPVLGQVNLGSTEQRRRLTRRLRERLQDLGGDAPEEAVTRVEEALGVAPEPFPAVLGSAELADLARQGVTIAAHTRTHCRLPGLPPERLAAEVRGSRDDLAAWLGAPPALFSYPYGAFDDAAVAAVRAAGFAAGFSTRSGFAVPDEADRFVLRRISVHHGTLARFRFDLTHLSSSYLQARARLTGPRRRAHPSAA